MRYASYLSSAGKIFNKHHIWPEHVTFFVTNKCNAGCRHCFYWKELNTPVKELTLDEVGAVSRQMGPLPFLLVTGGEPFLREDLAAIVKMFYEANHLRKVNIMTNGSMPDKISRVMREMLAACPELYVTVFVSFDGMGDDHDNGRAVAGLYKNALATVMGLKAVQAAHPRLSTGAALLYSALNEEKILDIYHGIKKDVNPDTLNCVLVRGDTRDPLVLTTRIDNFIKVQDMIRYDLIRGGLRGAADPLITPWVNACKFESVAQLIKTVEQGRYLAPCYAGGINIVIYPNGDVFPCELLGERLGNLREQDYALKKILFSARADDVRRKIRKTRCFCTHGCNWLTNVMFNPGFMGKVMRNYGRLLLTRMFQ